jgi:hypothetical protein
VRELLRETLFSPIHESEALYVPPFARRFLLRMAGAFERIGVRFALPGGGVRVIEATKQLYRPVALRKTSRHALPQLKPALTPTTAGFGHQHRAVGEARAPAGESTKTS